MAYLVGRSIDFEQGVALNVGKAEQQREQKLRLQSRLNVLDIVPLLAQLHTNPELAQRLHEELRQLGGVDFVLLDSLGLPTLSLAEEMELICADEGERRAAEYESDLMRRLNAIGGSLSPRDREHEIRRLIDESWDSTRSSSQPLHTFLVVAHGALGASVLARGVPRWLWVSSMNEELDHGSPQAR